jgi:hypothetical protein
LLGLSWLAAAVLCIACSVPITARTKWPSPGWPSDDENACADDVLAQVGELFSRRARRDGAAWAFHWTKPLPSAGLRPKYALLNMGVTTGHIQGFTRTYSEKLPFFATHSRKGVMLEIGPSRRYGAALLALEPLKSWHPGGVHVIGRYVATIDENELVLFDTAARGRELARYPLPVRVRRAGGGMGIARLADGTHLVLAAFPGSYKPGPRYIAFLRIHGPLLSASRIEHVGTQQIALPRRWQPYVYSENLSLVTECRTNALYALQTTGSDRLYGTGYVRVSQVELRPDGPHLEAVAIGSRNQRQDLCHFRSAATFFVTPKHHIELYCHERTVQRGLGLRDLAAFRFARLRAN